MKSQQLVQVQKKPMFDPEVNSIKEDESSCMPMEETLHLQNKVFEVFESHASLKAIDKKACQKTKEEVFDY